MDAADGLHPLLHAGIVHQCEDIVWPTRAAVRLSVLIGGFLEP
jgi:hypothetical protein